MTTLRTLISSPKRKLVLLATTSALGLGLSGLAIAEVASDDGFLITFGDEAPQDVAPPPPPPRPIQVAPPRPPLAFPKPQVDNAQASTAGESPMPAPAANEGFFYVGLVDLTYGKRLNSELLDATGEPYDDTWTTGRLAGYAKGTLRNGAVLTVSADTEEQEIENLLRSFEEKSARGLLSRIDPNEYYPVYGDDSNIYNDAPTSGRIYARLEENKSHIMWGDFKSEIQGTEYLRNERTLYGAQGVFQSVQETSNGDSRASVQVHAALPDTLPQRDIFLGTGGSTYFLKFQDITRGSESIVVELRDPNTNRVVERRTLVYGEDYEINYIQGLIVLRSPLSGAAGGTGLISENPNGDAEAYLIANYEHTPTATTVDAMSYGGRAEGWINDNVRVGISGQHEDQGTEEQTSYGADIRVQATDTTYVEVEYARTEGAGGAEDLSLDGGLTFNTQSGSTGNADAYRMKAQADLQDLGMAADGSLGVYYERRQAGFSTLSYRVEDTETVWGLSGDVAVTDQVKLGFSYDNFENEAGRSFEEGDISVAVQASDQVGLEFGVRMTDKVTPGNAADTGSRTDLGLKASYTANDTTLYAFGQYTMDVTGGLGENNRYGVGVDTKVNDRWTLGAEISDGTSGLAGNLMATYSPDADSSYYFGYRLDPERSRTDTSLVGKDQGTFVAGGRKKVNDRVTFFGESTLDNFGAQRSTLNRYGADFTYSDASNFSFAFETGLISDRDAGTDFERYAVSLTHRYDTDALSTRTVLEYREDKGTTSGSSRDAETIAAAFSARYKFNDEERLLFDAEMVDSNNADASIPDADYRQVTLGYAYRPIRNDKLNLLVKYQYLDDQTSRVGASPTAGANFTSTPRQEAQILSVDGIYDLNERWSLGAKVGGRWSEQDNGNGTFSNDATLGVLNLQYHMVHKWDLMLEGRVLTAEDLGTEQGVVATVHRHVGENMKVGLGYNFGSFSDDLADVTYDDEGVFLNLVGKF